MAAIYRAAGTTAHAHGVLFGKAVHPAHAILLLQENLRPQEGFPLKELSHWGEIPKNLLRVYDREC